MDYTQSESLDLLDYDPLADIRASLGLVINFSKGAPNTQGQNPLSDYESLKFMYFQDLIVSTANELKAEIMMANGIDFRGKNSREVEKAYKEFDRLDMDEVMLNFLKQGEAYGDAYLEPKMTGGGKVSEVWPLETPITRIKYNENGEVEGYLQINNRTHVPMNEGPTWEPDELLHYRESWFGSNVYSYAPNVSMAKQYVSRTLGNHYITQIFKNLPPKMVHILNGASKDQATQYRQTLWGLKSNMAQDLVVRSPNQQGKVDIQQHVVDFTKGGLIEVLRYVREEILFRMKFPMALTGMGDNKGRSEPQMYILETHLKLRQKRVAKFLNRKLMPLLGLNNVEAYFTPPTLGNEKEIMAIARSMIDGGLNVPNGKHPAVAYLQEKGIKIPDNTIVKDPKEKDIDAMPSRERVGIKQGKEETDNRDQQGDSAEGREKFKDAQVRAVQYGRFDEWWQNRSITDDNKKAK